MTLKIGSKLNGNNIQYVIESVLGQGSFGVTYKAKGFTKEKGAFGEVEVELPHPIAIKEFFMRDINQRDVNGSISGLSEGSLAYNYAIAADTNINWNTIPENIAGTKLDIANKLSQDKSMLPTRKHWKELIDKCEWHWADVNGVVGYRVIGRNGNSIFLPSTGNSNTYYWSASKASKYKCFYCLYFNSYNFDIMYNLFSGLCYIRPVL